MGAHTTATLDVARERTEAVRDLLRGYRGDDHVAQHWVEEITDVLVNGRTEGTLKAWMQRHDGEVVDTLQTTINVASYEPTAEGGVAGQRRVAVIEPARPWAPGPRRVDATRAAVVLLDGSRRDYAGVTTFLVTERAYIGFAKWGDDAVQMLVYVR